MKKENNSIFKPADNLFINTHLENISYLFNKSDIIIRAGRDPKEKIILRGLSSAVINGGANSTKYICNHHVPKNFTIEQYKSLFPELKKKYSFPNDSVVFMTAVKMEYAVIDQFRIGPIKGFLAITAGTTNAASPYDKLKNVYSINEDLGNSEKSPNITKSHTINSIFVFDCHFPEYMYPSLYILITEAKVALLYKEKIMTPEGNPATGTTTDAIGIFTIIREEHEEKIPHIHWGGLSTEFGRDLSKIYIKNLRKALKKGGYIKDA